MAEPAATSPLWGNIIGGVTVFVTTATLLGTIGGMRITPIEARLDAVDRRLDKIDLTMAPLLTLYAQHTSDLAVINTMQRDIDTKLSRDVFNTTTESLTKQVDALNGQIVSRSENVEHWNEVASRIDDINKRLAEMTLRINAQPSLKGGGG